MMAMQSELEACYQFVGVKLESCETHLSPDECVDLWHEQRTVSADEVALRDAIDDMRNGDQGRPFREVLAELSAKHQLPLSS